MRRISYISLFMLCLVAAMTLLPCLVQANDDLEYTTEEIRRTSAVVFLDRMAKAEPGYQTFAAMHALSKKAKESGPNDRWDILNMVVTAMNDNTRSIHQRFQCCYVISECGDEQWVPCLVYVLFNDPSEVMRSVAAEALGMFKSNSEAQSALRESLKYEKSQRVIDTVNKCLNQGVAEYTPEEIKQISAETFIEKMAAQEPGYQKFAAMRALTTKAKESDAITRKKILNMVVAVMNDNTRTEFQRFQCCYVISGCGDEQWVPNLIDVLMKDPSATMRAVAAEALAMFPSCVAARDALVQAASKEKNQKVIDVLNKVLGRTE